MKRYSVTKTEKRRKAMEIKIKGLMRVGFPRNEAEDLALLSKEEFKLFIEASKAKAYHKQTEMGQENREQEEQEDLTRLVRNFNGVLKNMSRNNEVKRRKSIEHLRRVLERINKINPEKASELESKLLPLESKELQH